MLVVTVGALAIAACAEISVTSPDGTSSASYNGTSIVGSEDVSCGSMAGVTTCSVSGQNLAGLAQAIVPYLGPLIGLPATSAPAVPRPTSTPTSAPTTAALETSIH